MKKIFILFSLILLLTGCSKFDSDKALSKFKKKANSNSYSLSGELSINNSENTYKYKVSVLYKKGDLYKVILNNIDSNNSQIILKNNSGVYVVTPALNKSFKFQSNWPYSSSEVYLLRSLLKDLLTDEKRIFKENKEYYMFSTSINYPSNRHLVRQNIYFDKSMNLKKVKVFDDNGLVIITMKFNNIKYNKIISNKEFILDNSYSNIKETFNSNKELDVIYPLNIPEGTLLKSEEKSKNNDRCIMTFDGDKSFTLVEEVLRPLDLMTVIPLTGEPVMLQDSYGSISDTSLYFTSNGNSYYLLSDNLNKEEMVNIASSINTVMVMK